MQCIEMILSVLRESHVVPKTNKIKNALFMADESTMTRDPAKMATPTVHIIKLHTNYFTLIPSSLQEAHLYSNLGVIRIYLWQHT